MSWYLYNFSSNSNFYVNRNMKEAPPQEKTLWGGAHILIPYAVRGKEALKRETPCQMGNQMKTAASHKA